MQWHKQMLRAFRDNAAYDVARYVVLLIWPFALAAVYTGLSWLGKLHWNWRINAGLLLIAVIILCFTAWKLIRQRPIARLSKLSRHLDDEIEKGAGRIERLEQRRKEAGPIRGFAIESLPPIPDTLNMTQHIWHEGANVIFTADAVLGITNLLPAQGIDLVHFRVLSISPPMKSVKAYRPSTQDTILRKIDFSDDVPSTLVPGKTIDVRLFKATRAPLVAGELKDISVEFYGKWPDKYYSVFYPGERHLVVVEVTGNGVSRKEETFELRCSSNPLEPVFTLTKAREPKPASTTEGRPKPPSISDVIRHEAWEKRQAEENIAITLPRANEVKRPIHFYYDQLEALIQSGSEMLESVRSNTASTPVKREVDEWATQLDDVATCCATVAERQALKNSRIGLASEDAFLDIAAVAPGEHYDTITEILGKLTVAKGIAARIHKEDKI